MDTNQTKQYEMLVRVNQFGEDHGDLFPKTSQAGKHFADVAAAVTELSGYTVEKMRAGDEGKSTKSDARKALASRLRTIGRTARLMVADNPDLKDKFKFPSPQTDQALIAAGRLFAEDAEAFAGAFIAQAMPKTFIADVKSLVDRFEQAIQARDAGKEAHASARISIAAALKSGTTAAQRLDAMMANHLHDDPLTVELWRRERKVGHPRRMRARQQQADPVPDAAGQPTTPAIPVIEPEKQVA